VGVLDDMLADAGGQQKAAGSFGDVVARAVGARSVQRSEAEAPSLDVLLSLDDGILRRLIRLLPAEAMVPLLARASVPVAQRLVGLLDAESQAWLAAQSDAIESCTPQAHAAAAGQALGLIGRAQGAGPIAGPITPPPLRRPIEVATSFSTPMTQAAPAVGPVRPVEPVGAVPTGAAPDDVTETLAALVALAAGRDARQLAELAEAVDHPVLADGLRAIVAGADGHAVGEIARIAGERWLDDQARRVALMRKALLAIRFGDGPDSFRRSAATPG